MPSRLRVAAGLALLLVALAVVAVVLQDHTSFLPLGLFNDSERSYRWISHLCLAALGVACAVFAFELVRDRKLAAGALFRRILVSFLILEGELTFLVEGEEVVAAPGTFVLVPPGVEHTFANRSDGVVRMVNVHAPAGFDLRLES